MVRLLDESRNVVLANGALPVVVFFPERSDVVRGRRAGTCRYEPLLRRLRDSRQLVVDLLDVLESPASGRVDDVVRGHYTARGNAIVARALHGWLDERGLLDPERLRQARLSLARDAAASYPPRLTPITRPTP